MPGRTISVKLDGKERRLRYDLNAISLIGDRLELSGRLNNLAADLLGKPLPLSALRTIVWAGLVWDQPDLTEEDVGSWIDLDNFGEVWERFFTLFSGKSSDPSALGKAIRDATSNVGVQTPEDEMVVEEPAETSDSPT